MRLNKLSCRLSTPILTSGVAQHRDRSLDQSPIVIRNSRLFAIFGRKTFHAFGCGDDGNSE